MEFDRRKNTSRESMTRRHRLIQRPVHQSFGLVKCTLGLVGLAKKGVFGGHLGSCDLINWVIFSFLLF